MKPIRLVLSGVGPFPETMPPIIFEKFDRKKLFLITGETGAGKTTIFDAICFALYGKTSGQYKNAGRFRCDFLKEGVESYVEFEFSHHVTSKLDNGESVTSKKVYIIKRPTSYQHIKIDKKGNYKGTETVTPAPTLTIDGELINPDNIEATIKKDLKIEFEQFKQIAMIAQGEFLALLNADTKKRSEILRKVFDTELYKKLSEELSSRQKNAETAHEKLANSIAQGFRHIKVEEESDMYDPYNDALKRVDAMATAKKGKKISCNVDELIQVIEDIIKEDTDKKDEITQELKETKKLHKEKNDIYILADETNKAFEKVAELEAEMKMLEEERKDITRLEHELVSKKKASLEVKPIYDMFDYKRKESDAINNEIGQKVKKLDIAKENAKSVVAEYEAAIAMEDKATELKVKSENIKLKFDKYEQKDNLEKAVKELMLKKDELLKKEDVLKKEEEELKQGIAENEAKHTELRDIPTKLANEKNTEKELEQLSKDARSIEKEIEKVEDLEKELEGIKAQAIELEQDAIEKEDAVIKATRLIRSCRAGILAIDLKPGMECPVCGATEHKKKAVISDEIHNLVEIISKYGLNDLTEVSEEKVNEFARIAEDKVEALDKIAKGARQLADSKNNESESRVTNIRKYKERIKADIRKIIANEMITSKLSKDNVISENSEKSYTEMVAIIRKASEVINTLATLNKDNIKSFSKLEEEYYRIDNELKLQRGNQTESLNERKKLVSGAVIKNKEALARDTATLESLSEMEYENLDLAKKACEEIDLQYKKIKDRIDSARANKDSAEKEVTELSSTITTLKSNYDNCKKQLAESKDNYEAALKENAFSSDEEFLSWVVSKETIDKEENEIDQFKTKSAKVEGALKNAEESCKGKTVVDTKALKVEVDKLQNDVESMELRVKNLEKAIENNDEYKDNISAARTDDGKKLSEIFHEMTLYETLYKLVSGNLANAKSITLEQFVQGEKFERILDSATKKLATMSEGKYELRRLAEGRDNRSKEYLDIEIYNTDKKTTRPAGNISGGESFMASLSLALALSEQISAENGGIEIDALFVDEGFGTLSKKYIETTLLALKGLRKTNKYVGIISHREELIEGPNAITDQIRVYGEEDNPTGKEGSTFKIVTSE